MQGPDSTEMPVSLDSTELKEPIEARELDTPSSDEISVAADAPISSTLLDTRAKRTVGFDWLALGTAGIIMAFFALAARIGPEPANSLTPIAVLSATGCGLLMTALRKLRTLQRPGLLEAALAGLLLALFQFLAAISYPTVLTTLSRDAIQRQGFLATWALVAAFSLLFSMVGAALGHLAFAPLRPLPARPKRSEASLPPEVDLPDEAALENEEELVQETDEEGEEGREDFTPSSPPVLSRSLGSELIVVLLLALAPTVVGYIFAAAYDYMLSVAQFLPGPFPTLRLLSSLLPWQLSTSLNLSGSQQMIVLLWRIPFFVGNPALFDIQALEPFVFNGLALALLLQITHRRQSQKAQEEHSLSWRAYLVLEATLGLVLILPAGLWMLSGLQGLLQLSPTFVLPIRTLHLLDPLTFILNLVTGPLICLAIGILTRPGRREARTI